MGKGEENCETASSWKEVQWTKISPILSWARVVTKSNKRKPSGATNAIIAAARRRDGKYWWVLDFEQIEQDTTRKLSDDDLSAVLACIDCQSQLRSLKLAGLVNITGRGLEPLRNSIQLEHLDFSLQKEHESPDNERDSMLSRSEVLPIIRSIISTNCSLLRSLHFPKSWLINKNREVD